MSRDILKRGGASDAYAFRRSQQRNRGKLIAFLPLALALYVATGLAFEALLRTWAGAIVGTLDAWGYMFFETLHVFVDDRMRELYDVTGPSLVNPWTMVEYWWAVMTELVKFNRVPWISVLFVMTLCVVTWRRWKDPLGYFSRGLVLVRPDLERSDHAELSSLVEEVLIAMGMPQRPAVRVAQSAAPFAYSVETSTEESAIVVSQGLLENLDKNELRAVLAHEMAHLQADDHVLNCLISMSTQWWNRGSIDSFRRKAAQVGSGDILGGSSAERTMVLSLFGLFWLVVVTLVTALSMAVVLGFLSLQLLGKAFLSRRRDFLADAAAVDALRDNFSLGRAILKHWVCYHEKRIPIDPGEDRRAHYLFINPYQLDQPKSHLWSPQPSVEERLDAIGVGSEVYSSLEKWEPKLSIRLTKPAKLKWW